MANKQHIEVIARGLILDGGMVLLCTSRKGGYSYLPGGHVEFGESASAAVVRELEEETGLQMDCGECLLVTEGSFDADGKDHHEINIVFHVEHHTPPRSIQSREDDIEFHWVDLAAVVGMDVRPAAIRAWLVAGGQLEPGAARCGWVSEMELPKTG